MIPFNKIFNRIRILSLQFRGIDVANSCKIAKSILFFTNSRMKNSISIGEHCELSEGIVLKTYEGSIKIKKNTFLGEYVIIYGHGGVTIGENTLIAMHTCIVSSNHNVPDRDSLIRYQPDILMPVIIGSDVWIGANCTILGGISIGNGAVIGAGSVVNKSVPEFAFAVGNPAKIIKYRK